MGVAVVDAGVRRETPSAGWHGRRGRPAGRGARGSKAGSEPTVGDSIMSASASGECARLSSGVTGSERFAALLRCPLSFFHGRTSANPLLELLEELLVEEPLPPASSPTPFVPSLGVECVFVPLPFPLPLPLMLLFALVLFVLDLVPVLPPPPPLPTPVSTPHSL